MKKLMVKFIVSLRKLAKINLLIALALAVFCVFFSTFHIAAAYLGLFDYKPFYINDSDSAPHGVYMARFNIQSEDASGARMDLLLKDLYYIVSLPVDVPALDKKAGFNLIKVCRGLPGTPYTVTDNELVLDGKSYPISDRKGLPHIKPGNYIVPDDTVLFLNDPDTSFDSRYLGPVHRKYVKRVVYYIGPAEEYAFWAKAYAVSLIISMFILLMADILKGRQKHN